MKPPITIQLARFALALPALAMATEDTGTPGPGGWENNLGVSAERQHGSWRYGVPEMELNYGAGERLQLVLGMPYVRVLEPDGTRGSGFGNITAGVKWRFWDDAETGAALAVFPRLAWNATRATAARGLDSPGYSLLLPLIAGYTRGDTGWFAELGRNIVQQGPHEWQAGVKVLHQCLPQLECRAELEYTRVPRDGGQTTVNVGGKWRLSEGLILNMSAGRDIAGGREGRRSVVTYIGLQWLR
jgi:hypothetical protein